MLPHAILPRLHKLVLLLSSDQPGEVAAARGAIDRLLKAHGATWHDLAGAMSAPPPSPPPPPPPPRQPPPPPPADPLHDSVEEMLDRLDDCRRLTRWEQDFVESVAEQFDRYGHLTAKQRAVLERICEQRT